MHSNGAFSSVRVSEVWAINIIGHVSSRIRYAGSPSMVSHAAMLEMAWRALWDRAGGLCGGR